MSDHDFDPNPLIDALAALLELDIDPAYRPGVATNLAIAARFAALVTEFDLGDHAEPAPVFRP
jgi:hypothetical protein